MWHLRSSSGMVKKEGARLGLYVARSCDLDFHLPLLNQIFSTEYDFSIAFLLARLS